MKVISALVIFGIIAVTYAAFEDELAVPADYAHKEECPKVDDPKGNATLVANPEDCGTYYACLEGQKILMKCPPKLHFNNKEKVCDWAWEACCDTETYPNKKCFE